MLADKINEKCKGELIVEWIGGPEAVDYFAQAEAVRTGVIDMLSRPAITFVSLVPLVATMHLSEYTLEEERETGFYDWMNELFQERVNVYYLGRGNAYSPFMVTTNVRTERPQDLAGQIICTSPIHEPITAALDIHQHLIAAPHLQFQACERGVAQGMIDVVYHFASLSICDVQKYAVGPPYYAPNNMIHLINLDSWKALPKYLQDAINEAQIELISEMRDYDYKINDEELEEALTRGMIRIEWSPEDTEWFLNLASETAWESYKKMLSPEDYAKARQLLCK